MRLLPELDGTPVAKADDLDVVATRVTPVIPPVAATEMTLEDTASAAVTGQIVVASWMVSVTTIVETCSGAVEARLVRDAELAGQSVTLAAQLRTVRIEVVRTVSVVSSSAEAVVLFGCSSGTAVADPEADVGRRVDGTFPPAGWVPFAGLAMTAPSVLPEKNRREA